MPEYLAPGVYVEEVSFRSKSIEGVPTSTTGFAGLTRYGPVLYANGPTTSEPRLITSFTEFEQVYGGLEALDFGDRVPYLAHAARAFFLNGGRRLYVSRVFSSKGAGDSGVAQSQVAVSGTFAVWRARWPGNYGNVSLEVRAVRSKNLAYQDTGFGMVQAKSVKAGAIVQIVPATNPLPKDDDLLAIASLAEVSLDPGDHHQIFSRGGVPVVPVAGDRILQVQVRVTVKVNEERIDSYTELATHPDQKRYIGHILQADNPEDENAVVWLDWTPGNAVGNDVAANLMVALQNTGLRLTGGNDGGLPPADGTRNSFAGMDADPDNAAVKATGLAALGELDDIAIVAMPDAADLGDELTSFTVHQALVEHCETLRYRIAVLDGLPQSSMSAIREYRGRFDSKYGALYHPWIEILDPTQRPTQGAPPQRLLLPPSGFVCGIYARSDITRGVHKAPANEVVLGLTRFEANINKGRQDVLNPEGINALRFFEGRGNRVWGARTVSSDPEWKYVNVRRLFIYLEHSLDKGTQWAVFEPNNERLWANMRETIENFLLVQWKNGALMGDKPEQAYFVRCDRTTMTQNDLDNGRMICLIGVAPVYPAEFVIFRIGQWTADVKM
jgi:phage tail sheath protein FI